MRDTEKSARYACLLAAGAVLIALIYTAMVRHNDKAVYIFRDEAGYKTVTAGRFELTTCETSDGQIRVSGWYFRPGRSVRKADSDILLKADDGTFYILPTIAETMPELTELYGEDGKYNYDAAGFKALAPQKSVPPGTYELWIACRNNGAKRLQNLERKIVTGADVQPESTADRGKQMTGENV